MLKIGDLSLDLRKSEVRVRGKIIDLTVREFEVLKYLANNQGQVVTREILLEKVWGYEYYGDIRTVDVTVRRIREKIEIDATKPEILLTKRGEGYYIANPNNPKKHYKTEKKQDLTDSTYKKTIDIYEKEEIVLWDEKIKINSTNMNYYQLRKEYSSKRQETKEYWMTQYKNITKAQQLFYAFDDLNIKFEKHIEETIKKLVTKEIYTKSTSDFYNAASRKIRGIANQAVSKYNELCSVAATELEYEGRRKASDIRHSNYNRGIFAQTASERQETYNNYINSRRQSKLSYIDEEIMKMYHTSIYKEVLEQIDKFYDELIEDYTHALIYKHEIILTSYIYSKEKTEIENMFNNLKVIDNKKKVLVEILKRNPLEKKAYLIIVEKGLFDKEVLNLCKKVYIEEELKYEIKNLIEYKNERNENYINALALLENKSSEEIRNEIEINYQKMLEEKEHVERIKEEREEQERKNERELKNIELVGKIGKWIIWIIGLFILSAVFNW